MSNELVGFLRARLGEDEQAARAVRVPPDWHQGPGDDPEWADTELVCMWPPEFHTPYEKDKHWRGLTVEGPELAAHIARYDPSRVLAEVEAKRRILDDVLPTMQADERRIAGEWGVGSDPVREASDDLLSLLALPYADHPDYREEWRA